MAEEIKVDAQELAKYSREAIESAEGTKIVIPSHEFKIVDLDVQPDKSYNRWTVVGGSPVIPLDFEIAANVSPQVSMIELQGSELDKNLFALKVGDEGVHLKSLSKSQAVNMDTLDENGEIQAHFEFDPHRPGEQRQNLSFQSNHRTMIYLGPAKYPIRVFQRLTEDGQKSVRMVFNPSIPAKT